MTFAPNDTSETIMVEVLGDTLDEGNETFFVNLSNANATIGDNQGVGTIVDDDGLPTLTIDDVTIDPEGDSGTTDAVFTVSLSQASGKSVTVDFATENGTATAGEDYTSTSGTLTIPAGSTSETISVPILGDTLDEDDETFFVNLSNPTNATIDDPKGVGTIVDDDEIAPTANLRTVEYNAINQQLNFPNLITIVKVRVENLGPADAKNVTAKIESCGPNCTILDGNVTFADIPNGSSAWSSDTYNLSYNLLAGVVDQGITWNIEYDDTDGVHHVITGVPELPLAAPSAASAALIPLLTVGYQNYPNAFNPETWIPYQLADAAEVTIGIYNPSGQVVRTLNLGLQLPGFYVTKAKAAYWDGRNNFGEKVASGVYFYVLQAGNYRTVKKMYLLK